MSTSSTHTRKRQYQPSNQTTLGPYLDFGRHVGSDTAQRRSPMSPALPEDVQSSLVNVGMRVRKAMSDANPPYKSTSLFGSAALPAPSAPVRIMARQELQPFCGLHKTGGWAVPETPSSSAPAALRQAEEDHESEDMPTLSTSISSSQNSFMSFKSSTNTKKRSYEDEKENDREAFFDEAETAEDETMSSSSIIRPIAQMKARNRKSINSDLVHIVDNEDDFEEASFLAPMDMA